MGGTGEILEWLFVGFSRNSFEACGKFCLERKAGNRNDDGIDQICQLEARLERSTALKGWDITISPKQVF